jgi:ppGpp synthetase/RelA/SpoT-type nucleotidyltranferase
VARPRDRGKGGPKRSGRKLGIDLEDVEAFKAHRLLTPFKDRYEEDAALAKEAVDKLIEDLEDLNQQRLEATGRVAFTAVQGRVKQQDSFLNKLFGECRVLARAKSVSGETLDAAYMSIKDLAGVRFSCPYFDEVEPAINEFVRPKLFALGYGTDLTADTAYADKDCLDAGDHFGYRSYHFYVQVPTVYDIFGRVKPCLCEVQARTELQHVWADKSHDLLYKPAGGWNYADPGVVDLMKQVSHNLRAIDEYLVDIRRRTRGGPTS